MQKWEYLKIDRGVTEEELNLLGAEGWELIAVLTGYLSFVFKRPAT